MLPIATIIIPCFNQAQYLNLSISSLKAQTIPNWEAVIVNDGSPDNTQEIAEALCKADKRIKLIRKANGGLSSARNAGMEASTGENFLFLDADDALSPRALELLTIHKASTEADLVFGGYLRFHEGPNIDWESACAPHPARSPLRTWLQENHFPVHSGLVSRQLAERIGGFDQELTSCEDWDYWLRCAVSNAKVTYLPEIIAYYRVNPKSMSTNRKRMLVNRVRVFLKAANAVLNQGTASEVIYHDLYEISSRLRKRLHTLETSETRSNLLERVHKIQHVSAARIPFNTRAKARLKLDEVFPFFFDTAHTLCLSYFAKRENEELSNSFR